MDLYSQWNSISDQELTVEHVETVLNQIHDEFWVCAACFDRLVDNVPVQKALLTTGINKSAHVLERCRTVPELSTHFRLVPADAQLCYVRRTLLDRLDRLNTYIEIAQPQLRSAASAERDAWDDDPWDETEETKPEQSSISLVQFLTDDLLCLACSFALQKQFLPLQTILRRHAQALWPFRLFIIRTIPPYLDPEKYLDLLPTCSPTTGSESISPAAPWRSDQDFTEMHEVDAALQAGGITIPKPMHQLNAVTLRLTAEELSSWYRSYIADIIQTTGMVDVALSVVQHGAAQGVPMLDELGEDLSFFSRFVYEAPSGSEIDKVSFPQWRNMEPSLVVALYLASVPPDALPDAISRFVTPYLFLVEARAERAGSPDPTISTKILYDYVLSSDLSRVAAIFEASKPTLPLSKRIIKNDQDMVRIALACLYGSDSLSEWGVMSTIFECLPVWPSQEDKAEDVFDMTITSLGEFVTPSTSGSRVTPADLLNFFTPLPTSSLSRALDILDIHLESGEILSRWSVAAPLRWFLRSHTDVSEQVKCANKMARKAGGANDRLNTLEDWEWLLEDMFKLRAAGENGLRGAFGLMSEDQVGRIFFSGLLGTGMFDIAKTLLHRSKELRLPQSVIEELCLSCSRDFYDNASSGTYTVGDMKLAYDCLSVAPKSDLIDSEREFIEATSRLSSFNIMSRPGVPITPLEIRLTKDRLSLISRVLSSNNDAYKHSEVILDMVYKLGYRGNIVAEVKTLAMLADAALQNQDFERAYDCSTRMVETVIMLRRTQTQGDEQQNLRDAIQVCWVACFQLGRHPEFEDVEKRLTLLGRTLELCPSDRFPDVLAAWRQVEKADIEKRQERLLDRSYPESHPEREKLRTSSLTGLSLKTRLQDLRLPSGSLLHSPDPARLASQTLKTVAANFPFGRGESPVDAGGKRQSGDMAHRVFSRGIGWLIGAEEE